MLNTYAHRVAFAILVGACLILPKSCAFGGGPPGIYDFVVYYESLDVWTVEGFVVDEVPGESVVNFGGLYAGESVVPDVDGYFSFSMAIEPHQTGIVSATAEDAEGLKSDVVMDYIQ